MRPRVYDMQRAAYNPEGAKICIKFIVNKKSYNLDHNKLRAAAAVCMWLLLCRCHTDLIIFRKLTSSTSRSSSWRGIKACQRARSEPRFWIIETHINYSWPLMRWLKSSICCCHWLRISSELKLFAQLRIHGDATAALTDSAAITHWLERGARDEPCAVRLFIYINWTFYCAAKSCSRRTAAGRMAKDY